MTPAYRRLSEQLSIAVAASVTSGAVPPLPAGGALLWRAFVDISRGRVMGYHGAQRLQWSELEAWQRLNGTLDRHHIDVLWAMDTAYLEALAKKQCGPGHISDAPISAGLFDAIT